MTDVDGSSAFGDEEDDIEAVDAATLQKALNALRKASPPNKRGRGRPPKNTSTKRKECSPLADAVGNSDEVTSLLTELLKEVRRQGDATTKMFGEMQQRISVLEAENSAALRQIKERDKLIADLEERVTSLETRERKNEIFVSSSSIETMKEDDFKNDMVDLLESKLKIKRDALDWLSYRKVGKRALIVAPCVESRKKLFSAARTERPRGLYVNEVLTKSQSKLFFDVRSFLKASGSKCRAFTSHGLIYVKKNPESEPIKIRSLSELRATF